MADTTANRGYPYPEASDDVKPYLHIQQLAEDVDVDVEAIADRVTVLEDKTTGRPLGRITQGTPQSISDNTATAITFAAADALDTHGQHDPSSNNTRITPNVPGYYRFHGWVYLDGRTDYTATQAWFRKNGSTQLPPGARKDNLQNSVATTMYVTILIDMNGSSDYIELMALQDNTASAAVNTVVATQFACHLEWQLERPL